VVLAQAPACARKKRESDDGRKIAESEANNYFSHRKLTNAIAENSRDEHPEILCRTPRKQEVELGHTLEIDLPIRNSVSCTRQKFNFSSFLPLVVKKLLEKHHEPYGSRALCMVELAAQDVLTRTYFHLSGLCSDIQDVQTWIPKSF
jgi:hypothetical protein